MGERSEFMVLADADDRVIGTAEKLETRAKAKE